MAKQRTMKARLAGERRSVDVVMPTVVGVTKAAEMLGVPKSNISRLRTQGRMPEPVPRAAGDSGADVWLEADVAVLAAQLAEERRARAAAHAE
jgi:hypothetical protein